MSEEPIRVLLDRLTVLVTENAVATDLESRRVAARREEIQEIRTEIYRRIAPTTVTPETWPAYCIHGVSMSELRCKECEAANLTPNKIKKGAGNCEHNRAAADLVAERKSTHGDWSTQSSTAQALKAICHHSPNWPLMPDMKKEAVEMNCVKLSRIVCGDFDDPDHWADIQGYAELGKNDEHKES